MIVRPQVVAALVALAQAERPNEACGLIGGRRGVLETFYPCHNAAESPTFFTIDPAEILKVMRTLDREGKELLGIAHSHPATRAFPSPTDVLHAHYPSAAYFIVSLATEEPDLHAFRIVDGAIEEIPFTVA